MGRSRSPAERMHPTSIEVSEFMRLLVSARHGAATLAGTVLLATAACVPATSLPEDCDTASVQRQATLSGESLDPSSIQVCKGQQVTIDFTIQRDAVLHLHGYDAQVPAQEVHTGETVTFAFDADQAGEFPIEIHTHDGPAEATVGTLVVNEP